MRTLPILRSASLLALASLALSASAQNLVRDPGFENHGAFDNASQSYDFGPDWDVSGGRNATRVYDNFQDQQSHTGGFFASLYSQTPGTTLRQSVATTAGRSYAVSFYLQNYDFNAGTNNRLAASFGNGSLTLTNVQPNPGNAPGYTLYSFVGTASAPSTPLTFTYDNVDDFFLDDVSVVAQAVPEPTTIAALGLGAVAMLRRRRKA